MGSNALDLPIVQLVVVEAWQADGLMLFYSSFAR